jgi:sarcosine/dimethylglycine N-methyltransferase
MKTNTSDALVARTRDYYNSNDADHFYFEIWGGEDIHIGIYRTPDEPIAAASRRTVETMASKLPAIGKGIRLLDLGSGYGGSARHLASTTGCHVTCLNLSETQNARNRELNAEATLDHLIDVIDGSFEDLPFADSSFDIVWSQDAFLHSSRRTRILEEVDRVLHPGGHLVFTDPMQSSLVPALDLKPVLARLHLDSLGSVEAYRRDAEALGWKTLDIDRMPAQLITHYRSVHAELSSRRAELAGRISEEYISRMLAGLMHWVEAGRAQRLDWGILHFQKPKARL